jgi:copper chaperone
MTTTEIFFVENIKCGGCAHTIKGTLEKILGIQGVEVYAEQHKVCVMGIGLNRANLKGKLSSLGYPETGKNSLLKQAKSIISCGIGRI